MLLTEQQLQTIRYQLNREPRGLRRIAAVSHSNAPLVLEMEAVIENAPFPTLYWLSSKVLKKAIGTIETQGIVKMLESRVQSDSVFKEALFDSHQRYVQVRTAHMLEAHKAWLVKHNLYEKYQTLGVGGIADWAQIRCLHMHYAHHLVDGNVVGQYLDDEYGLADLKEKEVLQK